MEILVCIKQVPDDSVEILFDAASQKPAINGVTPVVNAFDTYALEMAVRLKEAAGGEVTVVSIGDETVKTSLKNCLAVGGDYAFLVKDDSYNEKDTSYTAKALKKAKEDIEKTTGKTFDLIFCGKESTDLASAQVGIMLAGEMNVPVITNIINIEEKDGTIQVKQETEEGYHVVETASPCVVTVTKPNYDPRYPTIKNKMASRKKPIGELETVEAAENLVETLKVYEPAKRQAGVKIKEETVEESVAKAIAMMAEAKVF